MRLFSILFILLLTTTAQAQSPTPIDTTKSEGWYWDTALRGAWNFAGICYRNKIYYRKDLFKDKTSFLYQDSYLDMGVELGIAPFMKAIAYVTWQPILPLRFVGKIGYYKDVVGDVLVDGPQGEYNQGYLPFTGLNGGIIPDRFDANTLELELSTTLTLGGRIGENGALAFIYTPTMIYYHSFDNTDNDQYRYKASESIIVKKQDVFWKHNLLLGYSFLSTGITVGVSGSIQHVQSIPGIFRAGTFGVFAYEKTLVSKPFLTPYVRIGLGTWLKDRYLLHTFVVQAEFGLKYKFS